jgi:hypothetical protein
MGGPPAAPPPPVPPPPLPPPPPYAGTPLPSGIPIGAPNFPGWGSPTWAPGEPTRNAARSIHKSMGTYAVVLILNLLAGVGNLIALAVLVGTGTPVPSVGGIPVSVGGTANSAVAILLGLLGFVALILTIVAWVEWRSGIKGLRWEESSLGQPHSLEVDQASRGYSRAVLCFILVLVGAIVLVVVIFAQVFGAVVQSAANNTTVTPTVFLQTISSTIRWDIIVGGAILGLLQFLVYFFAAQSLSRAIHSLTKPEGQRRLEEGRTWMIVGGLFGFGALALALTPYAIASTVVGPLVVLYGILRIRQSYGSYLGSISP